MFEKMTLTQSDAASDADVTKSDVVMMNVTPKRKFDSDKIPGAKKSRRDSNSDPDKLKLNPSQIEAEFRVLQSLIPHIAHRQQLSEVKQQQQQQQQHETMLTSSF